MAAMFENIRNAITRLPMDWLWRNLGGHIPSCSRHVRHVAAAMATAVAQQQHIEYSAVMGIWRSNAWTNFDVIWHTTANSDNNNSHVIKY